jgi:hypothetical protein
MRRFDFRAFRPWAMIMAVIAAFTLATPVNADPVGPRQQG